MTRLYQIQEEVESRALQIASAHGNWPCRKGCDDCCRHLASEPRVSQEEWLRIASALDHLDPAVAEAARRRIREGAGKPRPVVCPFLDAGSGACLIYDARPMACRAYGFYAERHQVLGCHRIESLAGESPEVVWGNHSALSERLKELGAAAEVSAHALTDWRAESAPTSDR